MASDLIEEINITTVEIIVKFDISLKTSSITNDHFLVRTNAATPVSVTTPFKPIDISRDYNSIARTLTLFWNVTLTPLTSYLVTFTGLKDSLGDVVDDVDVEFTTLASTSNTADELPPVIAPPTIIDYSIVTGAFETGIINPDQTQFKVLESDPINGDYYLPADYNNGRIIVKFNKVPDVDYITEEFIKVQKREIKRTPARWETINAQIFLDSTKPWVYIDLPSMDYYPVAATPSTEIVYFTNGYEYLQENYKYRIIFSKNIST